MEYVSALNLFMLA